MAVGGIIVLAIVGFGGYKVIHHFTKPRPVQSTQVAQAKPTPTTEPANSVYKMMNKGKLGSVMTDLKGITLYTYAKDTTGVSNCSGVCLGNWPAYVAKSVTGTFPENITVIKRDDGTLQYAWKGMPLYYFVKDQDSGDTYGNGVGGVWSVVK